MEKQKNVLICNYFSKSLYYSLKYNKVTQKELIYKRTAKRPIKYLKVKQRPHYGTK